MGLYARIPFHDVADPSASALPSLRVNFFLDYR